MSMNKRKFLAAVAVAGVVVAGGSAFTSIGVTNNAGATAFVGGTVSQAVSGAALTSIVYNYSNSSNTVITNFVATFEAGADTKAVSTVVTGTTGTWTCSAITANVSTCTNATPSAGATNVAITVAN